MWNIKKSVEKGRQGETRAAAFLEDHGFVVLERNVRSEYGEVDIIAQKEDIIVFIEVKTWTTFNIDSIQYSIDKKKQTRIIKTAEIFLLAHPEFDKLSMRFDVIFISGETFTHIQNAFTA
ncbi:MAG: YraN family protein [Treponema sp.]|nr:YraN family protein [Treponema sp.]